MPTLSRYVSTGAHDGFGTTIPTFSNNSSNTMQWRAETGSIGWVIFSYWDLSDVLSGGETINSATLTPTYEFTPTPSGDWYAYDAATTIIPSDAGTMGTALGSLTSASTNVSAVGVIDITDIVQEVVSIPSWDGGLLMLGIAERNAAVQGTCSIYAYELGGNESGLLLDIDYTSTSLGGGASLPTIMHHRRLMGVS